MKNILSITLPAILFMLIFCEAVLWFIPVEDPYKSLKAINRNKYIPSQFEPHAKMHFQSDEGLPGIDSLVRFSTNNFGFRGSDIDVPGQKENYRVFLVGGSTTECLFIDDSKSNNKQLEYLLNQEKSDQVFEVYNAGKSGDITVDHIAMISHRIVHLQPDCIILLSGVNDFRRLNYDYTHNNYDLSLQIPYMKFILSNFQLFRRVYNIIKKPDIESIAIKSRYKSLVKTTAALPVKTSIEHSNLSYFEINLKTIIGICNSHNIDLILVTQATTWNTKDDIPFTDLNWLNFIGPYRYPENVMKNELEKYNDVIRKTGTENEVMVFDLAREIKASREFFYDDCHFNNAGVLFYATRLSELIYGHISK